MSTYTPTPEQDEAEAFFTAGCSLAIEAGAGTGKTATLELLARSTPRTGAYVAFNRAIVNEASERMPMNVTSSTAHSLAMRQVGTQYRHRLDSPRVRSWELARMLDLRGGVHARVHGQTKVLAGPFLASLVMRALRTFCSSADAEPGEQHVPYQDGLDERDSDGARGWHNNRELRRYLLPYMARAWEDLVDPVGRLPFTHDHYLKAWQLGEPVIPAEFILFDEAQDASPVMLDAIARQAARGAQLVWVGDSQQQIYEWRGAVNALASVEVDAVSKLTLSWRFGPAIADVANLVLDRLEAGLRIVGSPHVASTLGMGKPHAVLCRSNAGAVETVLRWQASGRKPHLVGGAGEVLAFARAAAALQAGESTGHPELACFNSWDEVQQYVASDPQGDDLKLLVRLLDDYGLDIIVQALDGMVGERAADVIVSTAHKAKGRQWETVQLGPDFADPEECGGGRAGEWRLLYVALTRAQRILDVRSCEPLFNLVREASTPTA